MRAKQLVVNGIKYRSKGFTQDYELAQKVAKGEEEISYGTTVPKEKLLVIFEMTPTPMWWFFVEEE